MKGLLSSDNIDTKRGQNLTIKVIGIMLMSSKFSRQTATNFYPSIDVIDSSGKCLAVGKPLNTDHTNNKNLIYLITKARSQHRKMFLSQFEATPERTKSWMRKLTNSNDQIFFLLEKDGEFVGHYGLIIRDHNLVELDNSILWDENVPKGFMVHVEHAILNFAFGYLNRTSAIARVLNHNLSCVAMHQKTGFKFHSEEPLEKKQLKNDDIILQISNKNQSKQATTYLLSWWLNSKEYWEIRAAAGYSIKT